jgi:hypothetical protein
MKRTFNHRWILPAALAASLVATPRDLRAQSEQDRNLLGGEVLGRAMVYSLNYERMLGARFGAGAGFAFWGNGEENFTLVPLYLSFTPVGRRHALYTSAGATIGTSNVPLFTTSTQREGFAFGTVTAGYQFRSSRGYILRPVVHFVYGRDSSILWPGFTIGRTF